MKILEYTFDTEIEFSGEVREHAFVLRCLPRHGDGATVLRESWSVEPDARCSRQRDSLGNELLAGSVREPHTGIAYRSRGVVRNDFGRRRWTEACHPLYRYPTPLTRPSEELGEWADARNFSASSFEAGEDAAREAFEALGAAIHGSMAYEPGSTSVATAAADAFGARRGVCQDFAHIAIAVLRRAGVPARYVSGLAAGEGATHAWVQAHIDGLWLGFDPTRNKRVDESYLPLAVGRDWSDCPVERGSFWGLVDQTQTVFMTVRELDEMPDALTWKRNA